MTTEYQVEGIYQPCPVCNAPVVQPFPSDWTMSLRRSSTGVTMLTPHRPRCEKGQPTMSNVDNTDLNNTDTQPPEPLSEDHIEPPDVLAAYNGPAAPAIAALRQIDSLAQPQLGLATTRELFEELFCRMRLSSAFTDIYHEASLSATRVEPTLDLEYSTVAGERGIHLEDSPHVNHAIRELELCGQAAEDPEYAASLVRTVKEFCAYGGYSGESAYFAIGQLTRLLRGEALSPLTDDPSEWEDRTEMSGMPWWQNRRDSRAMSHDRGKTFWLVDNTPDSDNPVHAHALLAPGGVEAYRLEDGKWWYRSYPYTGPEQDCQTHGG